MKKNLILILFSLFTVVTFAQQNYQDVVYLKNGSIFKGVIIEQIPNKNIKIETLDKKVFVFEISEIEKITKEEYNNSAEQKSIPSDKYFSNNKNQYYSIAFGYGNSYGGLGLRFQRRIGREMGIGYHAGLGYLPSTSEYSSSIWYSVGAKLFFFKALYLDLTYGTVARYKYRSIIFGWEEGDLFGPSILVGGDWFFNRHFGINSAIGASKNITNSNFSSEYLTFDIGFIYKFN